MNAVLAAFGTPDLLHHYFWAFWSRYSLPADEKAFLAAGLNCAITVAITVWCFKAACGTVVTINYAKLSLLILSNNNMCVSCRGIPHSWEKSIQYIFCLQRENGIQWCHKGRWLGTTPVTCSSLWDLLMLSLFLSDRPSTFSSWCCRCARCLQTEFTIRGWWIVGRCGRPALQSLCVTSQCALVLHPFPVCLPRGVNRWAVSHTNTHADTLSDLSFFGSLVNPRLKPCWFL